jgi:hypothetical protein
MKNSNSFFKISACLVFLLLCSSCIKEITYELGDQEDVLVVYGILTDQPGRKIFRVTRTNPFEKQVDSKPVSGVTLVAIDSKSRKYPFVELDPGSYMLADTLFQAVAGETYYLDIVVPNDGHYRSDLEIMPAATHIGSLRAKSQRVDIDTRLQLLVDDKIPSDPQGVYLRWKVTRYWQRTSIDFALIFNDFFRFKPPVICYMTEFPDPNNIRLFGSNRRDEFELKSQEVLNIDNDDKFFERNVFEVVEYRITAKAHDYWNNLNKVTNQSGTIFDPPPATVRGNIYNVDNPKIRILGYFELAAVDTARVRVQRELFMPFPIPEPCLPNYRNESLADTYYYTPECAFCVNIKGHSVIRPKFW